MENAVTAERLRRLTENVFHKFFSPEGREFRREWKAHRARHKAWALQKKANFQLQKRVLANREQRAKDSKDLALAREKNRLAAQYHAHRLGLIGNKVTLATTRRGRPRKLAVDPDWPHPHHAIIDAEFHEIPPADPDHAHAIVGGDNHLSRSQHHLKRLAQFNPRF